MAKIIDIHGFSVLLTGLGGGSWSWALFVAGAGTDPRASLVTDVAPGYDEALARAIAHAERLSQEAGEVA